MTTKPTTTVMPAASASLRAPSQSHRVETGLTERILRGDIKPGERLPTEPALMQTFGVSRSVVREAMSRLQASGLVQTRQGIGSFVLATQARASTQLEPVGDLKLQQKLAMLELRLGLESDAAAFAAQRRTPAQLVAMERALAEFERLSQRGEDTSGADFRFHQLVAQATGNEYYPLVLASLSSATIPRTPAKERASAKSTRSPRFGESLPQLRERKALAAQEHHAVLDAIRRADPAQARAAMYMHLNNSRERMRRTHG